jgi:hypothetical protein
MQELIIGSLTMLAAFFTALWRYKKLEPKWLRLFAWFTLAEFIIQFSGYFYVIITGIRDNIFIYNLNIFIEYGFYLFVFYKAVKGTIAKNFTLGMLIIFVLLYVFEIFIKQPFTIRHAVYNTMMSNIGEFFTLSGCFIYLTQLMLDEERVNFLVIPMFWMTTGIMIEVVGIFIFLAFSSYIISHNLDPDGAVYGIIMTVCNLIQYGFFTIGFLARKTWKENRF